MHKHNNIEFDELFCDWDFPSEILGSELFNWEVEVEVFEELTAVILFVFVIRFVEGLKDPVEVFDVDIFEMLAIEEIEDPLDVGLEVVGEEELLELGLELLEEEDPFEIGLEELLILELFEVLLVLIPGDANPGLVLLTPLNETMLLLSIEIKPEFLFPAWYFSNPSPQA